MTEKETSEPPELPPPLPGVPEAALAVAEEEKADVAEAGKPPPPPAPLFLRMVAYLFDWVLASAALFLILSKLIPSEHPDGVAALMNWINEILALYARCLDFKHPLSMSEVVSLMEKIREMLGNPPKAATEMLFFISTVQMFFFFAFFAVTEFFTGGASFGKKICNLRVANIRNYDPPGILDTFWRSAWKAFFYCSPSLPLLIVGIIDAHIPLFNARRRSWHDMFSRTEVIDARYAPLVSPDEADEDE